MAVAVVYPALLILKDQETNNKRRQSISRYRGRQKGPLKGRLCYSSSHLFHFPRLKYEHQKAFFLIRSTSALSAMSYPKAAKLIA